MISAVPKLTEIRHYIGGGYYLLIGQSVELGCDDWPDDEGVYLQHMTPEDGRIMADALRPAGRAALAQEAVTKPTQAEGGGTNVAV